MARNLEALHAMIWHQERILAYELAKVLIHKPKVTVWMIMLPLLLLFFMQDLKKYKAGIANFVDGFLKNKKTALDMALNAAHEGTSPEEEMAGFVSEARPATADQEELHEKQLREIACLMDHYRRLLTGNGETYEALIKNVYPSALEYQVFLDTLFDLEKDVIQMALRSNPIDGDARELAKLMQTAMHRIRQRECDRIFHD